MFFTQKRVFAGKCDLRSDPFCPYITNDSGRLSLLRSSNNRSQSGATPHARTIFRDGNHRV